MTTPAGSSGSRNDGRPARHHRHERRTAPASSDEDLGGPGQRPGLRGLVDDRRQRAVEVEYHGRLAGPLDERRQQVAHVRVDSAVHSWARHPPPARRA